MFEQYKYTCQCCGKTKTELHVHHIESLQSIIDKYSKKYNIDKNNFLYDTNYNKFIQEIIEYHFNNESIGIVVCPNCHLKLDSQYKRKTHDKKDK